MSNRTSKPIAERMTEQARAGGWVWRDVAALLLNGAQEIERLRAALEKYGDHYDRHCPAVSSDKAKCDCGFREALASHVVDEKAGDSPQGDTDETTEGRWVCTPDDPKDKDAAKVVEGIANYLYNGSCDPKAPVIQRPCSKCGRLCNVEVCAKCAAENGEGSHAD